LVKAYAPCPEMAAKDGLSLTHWAVEILIRNGIKVGPSGQDLQAIDQPGLLDPLSLGNPSGKKIAVVTAIFGGYDKLMPVHKAWTEHADFFLFSDQVFETGLVWQQVYANFFHTDPTRRARFVKLHLPTYFAEYDTVLWVDGNVLICDDPKKILEEVAFDDHDFATFSHPQRSS
ncbi:MAG: DUF616 domain-containing protein, partial [Cohaesibacter sp.]|nr:DUF616 domain-containing protein [Cohaesibacter sp.]